MTGVFSTVCSALVPVSSEGLPHLIASSDTERVLRIYSDTDPQFFIFKAETLYVTFVGHCYYPLFERLILLPVAVVQW
jgi:hypothetical protein